MRTHQRNLYRYFLRNGNGCTVPLSRSFGVRADAHIAAVNALEAMRLITINRVSDNYLSWTVEIKCQVIDTQKAKAAILRSTSA